MRPRYDFSLSSSLPAAPATVWSHAFSPAGVNRELRPLFRMTFPRETSDLAESWVPGERLFRSWILLGGLVPVDYDDLAFVAVEPGRRFLERSSMLSQRLWEHERVIEPELGGCRLIDRVRFEPRFRALGPVYAPVFEAVFRLRHRNLRRLFRGG